jgi:hypothetical protein
MSDPPLINTHVHKNDGRRGRKPIVFLEMNLCADLCWGIASNQISSVHEISAQSAVEIAQNKIGFFTNLPWRAGILP